ncbi:MAG: helix-turn-helix transcriptional regulator [Bacteroidetes bacterium]|nr:helix-turn-helix transcriptional regulator [Bacteroidota bacterium]
MASPKKTKFEMAVINKIAEVRREQGLSQDDLALFLDVTRGFIGQVESPNSPSTYSLNQINRLAYKLGCSLHDILPKSPIEEKDWDD